MGGNPVQSCVVGGRGVGSVIRGRNLVPVGSKWGSRGRRGRRGGRYHRDGGRMAGWGTGRAAGTARRRQGWASGDRSKTGANSRHSNSNSSPT